MCSQSPTLFNVFKEYKYSIQRIAQSRNPMVSSSTHWQGFIFLFLFWSLQAHVSSSSCLAQFLLSSYISALIPCFIEVMTLLCIFWILWLFLTGHVYHLLWTRLLFMSILHLLSLCFSMPLLSFVWYVLGIHVMPIPFSLLLTTEWDEFFLNCKLLEVLRRAQVVSRLPNVP